MYSMWITGYTSLWFYSFCENVIISKNCKSGNFLHGFSLHFSLEKNLFYRFSSIQKCKNNFGSTKNATFEYVSVSWEGNERFFYSHCLTMK